MATNTNNTVDPSSWGLTGTNATPCIQIGMSRHTQAVATRPPPRVDSTLDPVTDPGTSTGDQITQGFARMMEQFDNLASRVGKLESPATHDPGPSFDPFEEANREYDDNRQRDYEGDGRTLTSGLRNRWDPNRGRRDERYNTGYFRGRGGRTNRRGGPEGPQVGQARNRTNWDDDDHYGNRMPTCWDPPLQRGRHNQLPYDIREG